MCGLFLVHGIWVLDWCIYLCISMYICNWLVDGWMDGRSTAFQLTRLVSLFFAASCVLLCLAVWFCFDFILSLHIYTIGTRRSIGRVACRTNARISQWIETTGSGCSCNEFCISSRSGTGWWIATWNEIRSWGISKTTSCRWWYPCRVDCLTGTKLEWNGLHSVLFSMNNNNKPNACPTNDKKWHAQKKDQGKTTCSPTGS